LIESIEYSCSNILTKDKLDLVGPLVKYLLIIVIILHLPIKIKPFTKKNIK